MRVYVNHIFFCNCGLYLYLLYQLWPYRMLECTLPILGKRSPGFKKPGRSGTGMEVITDEL
jgi:hypothetical protein